MGCSTSIQAAPIAPSKSSRNGTISNGSQHVPFAESEQRKVLKVWKKVATDPIATGLKVFQLLFRLEPRIRLLFHISEERASDIHAMAQDRHLRQHSLRFMQAVGAIVDNVRDLEKIRALLIDLGRGHLKNGRFDPTFFFEFVEAIVQVWRGEMHSAWNARMEEAWRHLLTFVAEQMVQGYREASQTSSSTTQEEDPQNAARSSEGDEGQVKPLRELRRQGTFVRAISMWRKKSKVSQ